MSMPTNGLLTHVIEANGASDLNGKLSSWLQEHKNCAIEDIKFGVSSMHHATGTTFGALILYREASNGPKFF